MYSLHTNRKNKMEKKFNSGRQVENSIIKGTNILNGKVEQMRCSNYFTKIVNRLDSPVKRR